MSIKLVFTLIIGFAYLNNGHAQDYGQMIGPVKIRSYTLEGEVKWGQGLFQALRGVSIENALALKLINELRDEVEFTKLKIGDKLSATFDEHNELVAFTFSQNPAEKHSLKRDPVTGKWLYQFEEEPTYWHYRIIQGELRERSTLEEDLIKENIHRPIVAEIVNVLLCKINFRHDARMGDRFKVLLGERKFDDQVIQTKVLFTSYNGVRTGLNEAFYYEDEEKSSTYSAHYTEDGQALIRSGLRYPLSSMHIRSGYGMRRHPVTGRKRMHRGVDLRGRVGRPVHAVASGKVVLSTYNKYAGNKVAIKHRDGSTSYYFHLNKRKVRRGDWVISYQVIGSVGSTGRVTGPHLHFGFKNARGRWMNPLNKRMIATPKLEGVRFVKLQEQIAQVKGLLKDLEISEVSDYLLAKSPNQRVDEVGYFYETAFSLERTSTNDFLEMLLGSI